MLNFDMPMAVMVNAWDVLSADGVTLEKKMRIERMHVLNTSNNYKK